MAPRIVRARRFNISLFIFPVCLFPSCASYIQAFGSILLCVFLLLAFFFVLLLFFGMPISSIIISIAATVLWCLYECVYCCVYTFFFRRSFFPALGPLIVSQSVLCSVIEFGSHCFRSKMFTRCKERVAVYRTSHGSLTTEYIAFCLFCSVESSSTSSSSSLVRFGLVVFFRHFVVLPFVFPFFVDSQSRCFLHKKKNFNVPF